MLHTIYTQGNQVNSRLLMVGSQTANLTFDPCFSHNLCFKCPNSSCELILNNYILISFQWYKDFFNTLGFNPFDPSSNIWESTEILTPKVRVPLGVWRSNLSHSLTLLRTCSMTLGLPSWLVTSQPLALVTSPRLQLWRKVKSYKFFHMLIVIMKFGVVINAVND